MSRAFPLVVVLSSALLVSAGAAAQPNAPSLVTVSLAAEGERPLIDVPVDDVVWMSGGVRYHQAAVAALIVRAVHRIGSHVVTDRWL